MRRRYVGLVIAGLCTSGALVGCGSNSATPAATTSTAVSASPSTTPVDTSTGGSTSGNNAALDLVVSETNSKMPALMAQFRGMYTAITVTAEYPSTLIFTYKFAKHIDPAAGGQGILHQGPILDAACTTDVFPGMKKAGVTNPGVRYVWDNPDGSEITHYNCKQ